MVGLLDLLMPNRRKVAGEFPVGFSSDGTSGTEISGGYFAEEYLIHLQGKEAAELFDQMRRSDAQVKMLTSLIKNPIKSATWTIEAVDDSDEEKEIAAFIEHVLFNDMGYPDGSKHKSWVAFLHEALSFIDFGHSVFEIVHKVVSDHPKWGNYVGLKDLAFRSQKTVERWELNKNGSIKFIQQVSQGDLDADVKIRGEFLLVLTNEKEGDNYEGISALRPLYGNYFRKNQYRKIQATGIERAAMGVPYAMMSPDVNNKDEQFKKMKEVLKRFRSNPRESIVTPDAFKIGEMKLSHDSEKIQKVIEGENTEMSKAFLATFMEMGIGGSGGSYSLGSDLSDIFLSGIQLHANAMCEPVNYRLIRQLVEMKFGFRDAYPKIKAVGINDKAGKELADIVTGLADKGLLQLSDRLTQHMHSIYGLPDMMDEEELKDGQQGDPEPKEDKPDKADTPTPKKTKDKQLSEPTEVKSAPAKLIKDHAVILEGIIRKSLKERTSKMISEIEVVLRKEEGKDRRKKALSVVMPGSDEYAEKIGVFLAGVAKKSRTQVLQELNSNNVKLADLTDLLRDLPAATRERLLAEIDLITKDHDHNIEKVIMFTLNNEIDKTELAEALIKEIRGSSDRYILSAAIATGAKNFVSNMVNGVRNDVFQTPEVFDQIESFVFRNDSPQTDICKNLKDRVFSKEEYKTSPNLTPLHHNCDSYIEAQTAGNSKNKPIDPNGLTPTGTNEEVQKILRSKTI